MAMGNNGWLHIGVDEHPFATYFDVHQYRVLTHSHLGLDCFWFKQNQKQFRPLGSSMPDVRLSFAGRSQSEDRPPRRLQLRGPDVGRHRGRGAARSIDRGGAEAGAEARSEKRWPWGSQNRYTGSHFSWFR